MKSHQSPKKKIAQDRFLFLIEVLLIFFGIFLFALIPNILLPLMIDENSIYYEMVYYPVKAILLIIAVPIFLFLTNLILEVKNREVIKEEDISPSSGFIRLFSITKSNFKYQLLYAFLLYFLVLLPIDYLTYIIPGILDFQAIYLTTGGNSPYLLQSYFIFLSSALIIHCSVAVYEESLTRGFIAKRGADNFNKMSAVVISSFYFGLMHFVFILNPASAGFPIWFPFFYFFIAYGVGMVFSMFIIRKKWLLPVIIAHAINNIVSAHAVWNHLQGNDFSTLAMTLYLPLLFGSLLLFIWQFSNIKDALSTGFKEVKTYFQIEQDIEDSNGDMIVRIVIDLIIGLLIFFIGTFLFGIG